MSNIPECTDPEFKLMAKSVREWRPDYDVGDFVMRRPGTLGATGERGKVIEFCWRGVHLCAKVEFPKRTETFVASTYVKHR